PRKNNPLFIIPLILKGNINFGVTLEHFKYLLEFCIKLRVVLCLNEKCLASAFLSACCGVSE
ncbi:MAG: hypothetical protein QGG87_05750, partial [Nitrospinota bacterium]|nr:hypothetical protein [Nitrospinota bacterium]